MHYIILTGFGLTMGWARLQMDFRYAALYPGSPFVCNGILFYLPPPNLSPFSSRYGNDRHCMLLLYCISSATVLIINLVLLKMAETRPTPVEPAPSMLTHYMIMMAFTMLGIYCSTLVFGPSDKTATPLEGSRDIAYMSCDQVRDDALLPPDIRMYMGTKLRYQFGGVVSNETEHNGCTAVKV